MAKFGIAVARHNKAMMSSATARRKKARSCKAMAQYAEYCKAKAKPCEA